MRPGTLRVVGFAGAALLLWLGGVPAAQAQAAQAAAPKKQAAAKPAGKRVLNLRDPFRSLLMRPEDAAGGQPLPPGKRGLVITQLSVDGIVIMPDEKIAVVNMRGRNRAYFLRERDEVFNGYVARITEDAVVFKERATDAFGQTFEREVIKTLSGSGAKQ